jgi:hypothetical protein
MSARALRPLRVGEILDGGIKIYRGNARTLMGLTTVVVVPFQLLSAIVLLSTVEYSSEIPRGFRVGTTNPGQHATSVGAQAILTITGALVGLLTTAACVKAVSDAYVDQPSDARTSLRFALRRIFSLLWLEILMFVLLVLAFIALIIPGIWLYASWSVATPALLIEGKRGWGALKRSFTLVRHRWWATAAVILLANILVSIISGAIAGVLVALALAGNTSVTVAVVVVSVASAIASVLTRPFQAAVTTVLYYDLRIRREGYDVQLLAEQLGLPPGVLPPAAAYATGPQAVGAPGGPPYWPPPPGWTPPDPAAPPPAPLPGAAGPPAGAPPYWPPPPGWTPPDPAPAPPPTNDPAPAPPPANDGDQR